MSRDVRTMHPLLAPKYYAWCGDMHAADIDHVETCFGRTLAEQAAAYAKGRTAPGKIVTNAKPGQSAHNVGDGLMSMAFNFVIVLDGKVLDWSGDDVYWNKAIELAQARGLESLRPFESAHLQLPNWKQLAGVTA